MDWSQSVYPANWRQPAATRTWTSQPAWDHQSAGSGQPWSKRAKNSGPKNAGAAEKRERHTDAEKDPLPAGGGVLAEALQDALLPIAELEREWDLAKLQLKFLQLFRAGTKGVDFFAGSPWQELVLQYANNVFRSVFASCGDRHWLNRVDFIAPVNAGIRETFPSPLLAPVEQRTLERVVLHAHDRAYEEQRFEVILWETIRQVVTDAKVRKRGYEAFEVGRREAVERLYTRLAHDGVDGDDVQGAAGTTSLEQLEDFGTDWVSSTVFRLSLDGHPSVRLCLDGPPSVLSGLAVPLALAMQLFQALVDAGTLPVPLVARVGHKLPRPWPVIAAAVRKAYADAAMALTAEGGAPAGQGDSRPAGQGARCLPPSAAVGNMCPRPEAVVSKAATVAIAAPRAPLMTTAAPCAVAGKGWGKSAGKWRSFSAAS